MVIILDCFEKFLLFLLDWLFDGLATDWKPFSFVLCNEPHKKQRILSAVAAEKNERFEEQLVQLPHSSPPHSGWAVGGEGSTSGGPLARQVPTVEGPVPTHVIHTRGFLQAPAPRPHSRSSRVATK